MFDAEPMGWAKYRLRDLFRERKEAGQQGLPIASVSIQSGLVLRSTLDRRVVSELADEGHALVRKDDIVYNMMRMWQGACGLAKSDCLVSPAYVVMTPLPEIFPQFALAMLRSPDVVRLLHAYSHGVVDDRLRLYPDAFGQIPVSLPPLDEQRRIAEVLRLVDEVIESQSAVRDQLAKTFNQLVEACFSEEAEGPRVPLGEVCQSIQVGIVIRPASYYVASGGIPALRSLNVGENRLDLDDLVYISEDGHRLNSKSSLRPGDVVTRRTGEPGKSAVIPATFDGGLNCIDIIFSRPKNELRSLFLSFFMNSDAAKRQVAAMQGGLAQQHLNVGEMKKLKVPLPALERQDEVVAVLNDAWDHLEAEGEAVRRLSSLKSGLASDLLSGRVRVPA